MYIGLRWNIHTTYDTVWIAYHSYGSPGFSIDGKHPEGKLQFP